MIVPTFDERANVAELVRRLQQTLAGVTFEILFVDDDSPDGTAARVRELGRHDRGIRCLQRLGRRGLSSACIEGMLATSAEYLAVLDGDLQHDETLLPLMLEELRSGDVDIVIGSRYAPGGIANLDETRSGISRFATWLSRFVLRSDVADPMSGFFMIRRDAFEATVRQLSGIGFKLLLDLMVSAPRPLRFQELPYAFRPRHAGRSKLDNQAAWAYTMLLLDKLIGNVVPVRFISFGLIGSFGVLLHLFIVYLLFEQNGVDFTKAQATATALVLISNFALNNVLTYRDKRLRGWSWFRGLLTFALACGVGALANVGVASYLFQQAHASWVTSAIVGIIIGSLWNYVMTSRTLWRVQRVN